MRVLVAFDGSTASVTALELVRALAWPKGSVVRVVQVVPPTPPLVQPREFGKNDERLAGALATSVGGPWSHDVTTEARLVAGDAPADAVAIEARAFEADVVVAGHRGHSAMTTVFLGSVARDLTERCPCPVLIARSASCDRIVFAEDGSDAARDARRVLRSWPVFRGKSVRVVSVAQVTEPLLAGVAQAVRDELRAAQDDVEMEARVAYGRLANEAADDLTIGGVPATSEVRSGDVAEQIVEAAKNADAHLIVMGTRGRGAVTRALIGSVARSVLLAAPCSVLVVRT